MDWDKIRIFYTVAEAGSFTRAGDDLGLSQSAVSRQISALERELKAPLFHRHARGLILTEQGDLLFRAARGHAHAARDDPRRASSRRSERPSGELKVTTTRRPRLHLARPAHRRVPRPLPGRARRAHPDQRGARPRHARGRRRDPPAPPAAAGPDPAPALHGAFPRLRLDRTTSSASASRRAWRTSTTTASSPSAATSPPTCMAVHWLRPPGATQREPAPVPFRRQQHHGAEARGRDRRRHRRAAGLRCRAGDRRPRPGPAR